MATGKLFIGRKVRELRLASRQTQAQFAERLGISTSYLNQIESNQRPVSATVLVALVDKFKLDFSELASGETDRLLSALSEALSDPLFEAYSPSPQELKLITQNAPGFAHALIACHQAYRRNSEQLVSIDRDLGRGLTEMTAYEEVRDFFHFVDNYIHDLDAAAESRAATLKAASHDQRPALADHLKRAHGIRVAYATDTALQRDYNRKTGVLTLNAYAPPSSQAFQLSITIAQQEAGEIMDRLIADAGFRNEEAGAICRLGLANYFAGALLMPYGIFARAAREMRHDIELLSLRFGTSLEQVCHRLSTLQRPNDKGVPIFFARIDRAGNITKRHSATRLQFARFGSACPLWNAHFAFEAQGSIIRQLAETPDGVGYLSLATAVSRGPGGFSRSRVNHVLAFGCEITHADAFVYADDLATSDRSRFDPIGISCRICERADCPSRAQPPLKRSIVIDADRRADLPYGFL
ncbi:helix-turn-helix transcriptional regulator [Martelella sp. HB161492]|uniref:helix-turn-helix domain-containing protein n=1 Tax=Martelella sp. HB161492 TaxID=2720726 RepID=UPI0015914F24|nr:helix-turn-helix transcriptional regulator [Martelella sp. HB161492]